MAGYNRYIRLSKTGSVVEQTLTKNPVGQDWIPIEKRYHHLLNGNLGALYYDALTKELRKKKEIKLVVGGYIFPADGVTNVAIGIRGSALENDTRVILRLNDKQYSITKTDDIQLRSSTPGNFIVEVLDKDYYSVPSRITITALEPERMEQ